MRHLLCSGLPDFPVDKLRSATLQIKRDNPKHFPPGSVRILKDIYDTRATEIRYENGEIGKLNSHSRICVTSLI